MSLDWSYVIFQLNFFLLCRLMWSVHTSIFSEGISKCLCGKSLATESLSTNALTYIFPTEVDTEH